MKKIKSFEKRFNNQQVDYYQLSRSYSEKDIQKIVEILRENGVTFERFRLSNSLDQPDHFFRVFPTLKDLYACPTDDKYIDDFGVDCIYNNVKVALSFDFAKNQVITIVSIDAKEKVDLEKLLMQLER